MTEAEWLNCGDSPRMLKHLGSAAGDRKLRLFACACCARIWSSLTDDRSRSAVLDSERYAEGTITAEDLEAAADAAGEVAEGLHASTFAAERANAIARGLLSETDDTFGIWEYASLVSAPANAAWYSATLPGNDILFAAGVVAEGVAAAVGHAADREFFDNPDITRRNAAVEGERRKLAGLVREIFGNPFRPVALYPAWRTTNVLALAEGVYVDRAFDRMPILADALEDAGCDNPNVLDHCRKCSPHVRGCWVVDLVLGKG